MQAEPGATTFLLSMFTDISSKVCWRHTGIGPLFDTRVASTCSVFGNVTGPILEFPRPQAYQVRCGLGVGQRSSTGAEGAIAPPPVAAAGGEILAKVVSDTEPAPTAAPAGNFEGVVDVGGGRLDPGALWQDSSADCGIASLSLGHILGTDFGLSLGHVN
jgi:hypothetical protein